MLAVLPALVALALLAQPAPRRVAIRALDGDTKSVIVAQRATRAIVRQLERRPDLSVSEAGDELEIGGGIVQSASGYLGILIATDATGHAKTGESCRSGEEVPLTACLLEAADRLARDAVPPPVGRAGGTIVVSTLDAYRVPDELARNVSGVVRIELSSAPGIKVAADKGDWEVRGAVGRLDDVWIVSLELLDADGQSAHRASEVFSGPRSELVLATRVAARRLVGIGSDDSGDVSLTANVDEAQLSIDGAPPLPFHGLHRLTLDAGKHQLALSAEGHRPLFDEFYVLGGQSTKLNERLSALPDPWYRKWWVWTALGAAVVVSGTIVGVAAASRPDDAVIEIRIR